MIAAQDPQGCFVGAGVTGFWYQQISDNSGDGATFGAFRARVHGIGPVLSYGHDVAGKTITAELKWLHEFDNRNRLEGDTIFLQLLATFFQFSSQQEAVL